MGRQALRSLTPGPSPGGRGGNQVSGIAVGCAVRTVTDVEGAHSAPYKLHPFSQVPPLPPGEGPGVRSRRAGRRIQLGSLEALSLPRAPTQRLRPPDRLPRWRRGRLGALGGVVLPAVEVAVDLAGEE